LSNLFIDIKGESAHQRGRIIQTKRGRSCVVPEHARAISDGVVKTSSAIKQFNCLLNIITVKAPNKNTYS
jgi:hypothetical protein